MNGHFLKSEVNHSPIPAVIRDELYQSGLWINLYYDNVASGFFDLQSATPRKFEYYVIAQLIGGDGHYWNSECGYIQFEAGSVILATPGYPNSYGGREKGFVEDALGFLGPTADAMARAGIIRDGVYELGQSRELLPVINRVKEGTLAAQLEASSMLSSLIFKIYHARRSRKVFGDDDISRFEGLLAAVKKDMSVNWSVESMADFCGMSEYHLRKMIMRQTGYLPKLFIDTIKMSEAACLLRDTELKISVIAKRLGYDDSFHFIRRFKHIMKISPGRYRKTFMDF